jgi:hypothetical protein
VPKGLILAYSRPASLAKANDYNDWYDNEHLPEVLTVPGIQRIRRYKPIDPETGVPDPEGYYLAVIEIEGDDMIAIKLALEQHNGPELARLPEIMELDPQPPVHLFMPVD